MREIKLILITTKFRLLVCPVCNSICFSCGLFGKSITHPSFILSLYLKEPWSPPRSPCSSPPRSPLTYRSYPYAKQRNGVDPQIGEIIFTPIKAGNQNFKNPFFPFKLSSTTICAVVEFSRFFTCHKLSDLACLELACTFVINK